MNVYPLFDIRYLHLYEFESSLGTCFNTGPARDTLVRDGHALGSSHSVHRTECYAGHTTYACFLVHGNDSAGQSIDSLYGTYIQAKTVLIAVDHAVSLFGLDDMYRGLVTAFVGLEMDPGTSFFTFPVPLAFLRMEPYYPDSIYHIIFLLRKART
jgi:hypothetical protein